MSKCVYFLFFSLPSLPLFNLFRLFCLLSFFLFFSFAFVALHSLSCLLSSFSSVFSSTSSVSSVFSASFFSFAFVVSTVSSTSFPLFFCRSFRLFRFSRFLPLLLPSHLPPSGFFCSFHLFLSLLFKSPVNLRMFVSTSRLSLWNIYSLCKVKYHFVNMQEVFFGNDKLRLNLINNINEIDCSTFNC